MYNIRFSASLPRPYFGLRRNRALHSARPSAFFPPPPPLQITMIIAAIWFLAGAGINAGAQELWMLVLG